MTVHLKTHVFNRVMRASYFFLLAVYLIEHYNSRMKIINRSCRYRFYPTDEQKIQLSHDFGCSLFVYNYFLKKRTDTYYERKEKLNYHKTSLFLTELKNNGNYSWLKDVSSITLQQSLRDLDKAFTNFFAGRARYPKFKKRNAKQSVRYVKSGFTLSKALVVGVVKLLIKALFVVFRQCST